jgi:hypothetical protein
MSGVTNKLVDAFREVSQKNDAFVKGNLGFSTMEDLEESFENNCHAVGVTTRQIDETTFVIEEEEVFAITFYLIED